MTNKKLSEKQEAKMYYKWLKLRSISQIAEIHKVPEKRIVYLLKKYYNFLWK
ncbi:MAG: hypothetical protein ACTSPD_15450 [Promethearchaeota archaeon]